MTKTQCRQFSLGRSYLLQYCSTRLPSYFHILQCSTLYTQPLCIQFHTCVWCCMAVYAYPMLCIFPYAAQYINLTYLYCHKLLLLSLSFSLSLFPRGLSNQRMASPTKKPCPVAFLSRCISTSEQSCKKSV